MSTYAAIVLSKCFCCRRCTDSSTRRKLDQLEEGSARFENALDIRSLLKTQLDLRILVHSLLNKRQRALFALQRQRALKASTRKSRDEEEEGNGKVVDISSCEELMSLATKGKKKKRNKKLAEMLLGMKALDQLDRKLVLGVLQERPYRDIEGKQGMDSGQSRRLNENNTNRILLNI